VPDAPSAARAAALKAAARGVTAPDPRKSLPLRRTLDPVERARQRDRRTALDALDDLKRPPSTDTAPEALDDDLPDPP
jgi:hypothetical protein